jgi:hypothetical protein
LSGLSNEALGRGALLDTQRAIAGRLRARQAEIEEAIFNRVDAVSDSTGIGTSKTLSPSGDYCSYARLGDELKYQDSTNEGGLSGFATPTPYSSYHYRLVATSAGQEVKGSDETFTTPSAPVTATDHAGNRWVAVEGAHNSLDVYEQSGGEWDSPVEIGGPGTTYSAPSVVIDPGNDVWVSAEGAEHSLDVYERLVSNGKWGGPEAIGGFGTTW